MGIFSVLLALSQLLAVIMTLTSYFKKKMKWDEPLAFITITASLTGCFFKIAPPLKYRKYFFYIAWYHIGMFMISMLHAALSLYYASDFFSEGIEPLRFLVTGAHVFAKQITMVIREKQFLELFDQIRKAWGTYQRANRETLSRTLQSINTTSVIIGIVVFNTVTVTFLGAIAKNANDPEVIQYPLQTWIPPQLRSSFVAGTLYQLVPYMSPVVIFSTTFAFLNSITAHVEALGQCLARDIRGQKNWEGEETHALYKKHQEVIRIVHRINALMASNWGFEMLCSTLQLTLVAYNTLRCLKRNDIEFFNQVSLLCINFVVIHLIYGNGNRILKMGEELHSSIYETKWYESKIKDRKNVLLMMFRTTHPMEYRFKITHFDLPGFAKVVNTTFSYITLLRSLEEPDEKSAF